MSNKRTTSYATMSKWDVEELALSGLKAIQKARIDEFESMVQDQMKVDQRTIWEMILRKPKRYMTREEATKWLKLADDESFCSFSEWQQLQWKYGNSEERLESLLSLAQNATDKIYLSAEDMNTLTYWGVSDKTSV